jgi:hypothetical protein
MKKYEIREAGTTIQFDSPELATAYNPNSEVFEVDVVVPVTTLSAEERLAKDIEFGDALIKKFLQENRDMPVAFNVNNTLGLLNKFAAIESLSRLGNIETIYALVQLVAVDEIFTQERKSNFIAKIEAYLADK